MISSESDESARVITPHAYGDDLLRILAVLYLNKQKGKRRVSALEISQSLRDDFGLSLHWRTIDAELAKANNLVQRKKHGLRWEYLLLSAGEDLVSKSPSSIVLVDPSNALQAVISLHDLLANLNNPIQVCDPYLDSATLEHLATCPKDAFVSLLTKNVRDTGRLRQLVSAARIEGRNWEIRVAADSSLHDRYIIDSGSMLILGTSLNGFGKKQCFIIKAGEDIRQVMQREFSRRWSSAQIWPSLP